MIIPINIGARQSLQEGSARDETATVDDIDEPAMAASSIYPALPSIAESPEESGN